MLFAQAAFALAVCDPARASSRASMLAAHLTEQANCHEPADNTNLCLTHCQSREQTLDKHQIKVPDVSLQTVLSVPPRPNVRPAFAWSARSFFLAAGPPLRILFRSLLI